MNTQPLTDKRILVTRPAEQAARLASLIREAGGIAVEFPAILIAPPSQPQQLAQVIARLNQFDLAIFISPTAVTRALQYLTHWPEHLPVAAIGSGSARALQEAGVSQSVIAPIEGNDSETLLAMPEILNMAGRRVVIFRGEGGREHLADTLRQRGALVEYAECYRREKPGADIEPLLTDRFDAVIVTSTESLNNLRECLGTHWNALQPVPFFVPHARIAEAANKAGVQHAIVSPSGDAACLEALSRYFHTASDRD